MRPYDPRRVSLFVLLQSVIVKYVPVTEGTSGMLIADPDTHSQGIHSDKTSLIN